MKTVIKRDGSEVNFNRNKIKTAIINAMSETKQGIDEQLAEDIAEAIEKQIERSERKINVEDIQDLVEDFLMASERKDAAKKYIIYRYERDKTRDARKRRDGRIISDEFISVFKHAPSPMNQLGNFVYYRTYSRWLPDEQRREYWWETVRRAVEYNCSLVPTSREEAEKLYRNVFELKQFLSGRTLWVGSTDVAKYYPMANFNCSFQVVDSFAAFKDIFYLLMVGSGVGVRVLKSDVEKLPMVRTDIEIIHESYTPVPKALRQDSTSLEFTHNDTVKILIGDSKEGWVQALDYFLKVHYSTEYRKIKRIILNYDQVRNKGERLKTFGGTASGHSSMKNMFIKISKVVEKAASRSTTNKVKLMPIDCLDIANIIGENVVVGGVRRTAEIVLIDSDDKECIQAKNELYKKVDEKWVIDTEIAHRQMSNNSIYYTQKPTREQLHWHLEQMRYSGEPGWVNAEAGARRRPNFNGVNPCGEVLLDSKGMCNLTTVNVMGFVKDGKLDREELMEAQRLSARAAYRMTCTELEIPEWNAVQQRDKLLGCSLTGWQDMVNALSLSREEQVELLQELRQVARNAAKEYARELGQREPLLVTTIKPEGTISLLPVVSSGVHFSHAPYFVRRIRISSDDPLVKVCEELGYPVYPEVGQDRETCVTKVVEFPVKSPSGRHKGDVSAIEQLEIYKMFMEHYVDHNCSITVHVRDHEWEEVEQWVWDNWDDTVALTFLSYEDNFYDLLPFEEISEEEYNRRVAEMKPFIPSLISKYEKEEVDYDIGDEGCEGGNMSGQIIVTISTQPGCGGAEIGQRLARRMPAVYVDKRLVAKAANGLDAVIENSDDTKTKSKFWELLGQTPILTNIESYIPEIRSVVSDAEVHEKEEEILLKLVGKNTAVVVGRAGFYRFREHPRLVKVFLGGDWQYRHDNYKRFYGLSDEDAEDLLRTTDQATERYIYKVTGKDMLDIRNYDLSFNVSKIDFNVVVNLILDYVHYRFQ